MDHDFKIGDRIRLKIGVRVRLSPDRIGDLAVGSKGTIAHVVGSGITQLIRARWDKWADEISWIPRGIVEPLTILDLMTE